MSPRATPARTPALLAPLLLAAIAAASPASAGCSGVLEPWCDALLASSQAPGAASATSRLFAESRPFYAVDAGLLAQGRVRLELDAGPGGRGEDLRATCLAGVPSLDWEGAAGARAQVTLAIADLPLLAAVPGLFHARRPPCGLPLAEAIVSEGVHAIGADAYPDYGRAGEGIRVGVIDQGFAGLSRLLGTEIPADTRTRSFFDSPAGEGDLSGGGIDHGTACAEIVHDVAPGARLYLANIYTSIDLEAAIRWMREQGVEVISHSVGWFEGGGDGSGPIHEIVAEALDAGILWVNAAGNQALDHHGGPFSDADGDSLHAFDESGDETISFAPGQGGRTFSLVLTWDRWPYSTDLAFDIEIYEDGALVASTSPLYYPPRYAYRALAHARRADTKLEIAIRRTRGDDDAHLRLFRLDAPETLSEHARAAGSLLIPADGERIVAAGAYRVGDGRLEDFSSRGPTVDGRAKPELCAPDRVRTATTLAQRPDTLFSGTSAAAPHVAGAAALLLACSPEGGFFDFRWSLEETRSLLAAAALPDTFDDSEACRWGLLALPDLATGAMGAGSPLRLLTPAPWPLRARLTAASTAPWQAEIFDAAGRRLHALRPGPGGPDGVTLLWDGRAPAGTPAPSGRYWLRLRSAGRSFVCPFVVVR